MKKTLLASLVVGLALIGAAETKTYTAAECQAAADYLCVVASTNLPVAQRLWFAPEKFGWLHGALTVQQDLFDTARRLDTQLSAAGLADSYYFATKTDYPLASMAYINLTNSGVHVAFPNLVALAGKYGTLLDPVCLGKTKATLDDCLPVLTEYSRTPPVQGDCRVMFNPTALASVKSLIQRKGERQIRRCLRAQGKSFVTSTNGVNPCASYMASLNTALNAPYFNGLNAWLEQMGCSNRVDVSGLPTPAQAEQLKNDILNADTDITQEHKYVLNICLGVDGYNAFVKEYNGENN